MIPGSNSHEVFGGSGLGLFVSRKLCELMGGNIDVDTIYGEGANFRFYVTMQPSHENRLPSPQLLPLTSPPSPQTKIVSEVVSAAQTAYHILITEDNVINQVRVVITSSINRH